MACRIVREALGLMYPVCPRVVALVVLNLTINATPYVEAYIDQRIQEIN